MPRRAVCMSGMQNAACRAAQLQLYAIWRPKLRVLVTCDVPEPVVHGAMHGGMLDILSHDLLWAQDQLAGHEAFAAGRAEAAARIKASGDDSKDAASRDTAANKWMRSVVLPFAKYKRDEALRIKSDEVGSPAS